MNILITYDSTNGHRKDGSEKPDATGAFITQASVATRVRREMGDEVFSVACNDMRSTLRAIDAMGTLDAWWYFGHGTTRGLPSIGARLADARILAQRLSSHVKGPTFRVALFACSTGDGSRGFASELAQQLRNNHVADGWVDSHDTAAHTTTNPNVVRWYLDGPLVHYDFAEDLRGLARWSTWCNALDDHDPRTREDQVFRFSWPMLERDAVLAALDAMTPSV